MRTYSHVLLTWAAARRMTGTVGPRASALAASGAALPDLPAICGALWLAVRRRQWFTRREFCREACGKGPFGAPDAALHSALPVATFLTLRLASGARGSREGLAFGLGWAAHVLADALTHAEDARPILWPLSQWRFRSPVSYWDRSRHALPFALVEHAAILLVAIRLISRRRPPVG